MSNVRGGGRGALVFLTALAFALTAQAASYGPVGSDETLWSIAGKVNAEARLGSRAQAALALYRANPQAFGGSPGRIRPGSVLEIPSAAVARQVPPGEAFRIVVGGAPLPAALPTVAAAAPLAAPVREPAKAPARPASPDPRFAPPSPREPAIHAVEILTPPDAQGRQTIAITGVEFVPGARLMFRNPAGALLPGRRASVVTPERIEFTGRLGRKPRDWQVAVINPGEPPTAAFAFSPVYAPAAAVAVAAVPAPAEAPESAAVEAPGPFATSAEKSRAGAMTREGQRADDVYKYLLPFEEQYAGDVDYDYALGVAALDSGRQSDAVMVLQRAVASRPGFAGARMELARAYYALGDNESARREFVHLQGENPPEQAARAIEQYLEAIDRKSYAYATHLEGWLDLGLGYDSNANGGPEIQNFLGFTLDPRNQSSSSNYYGAALGGAVSHPFAPHWRVLAHGQVALRENPDVTFVNSQTLRMAGGIEWAPAPFTLSLVPGLTRVMLDGEENSDLYAADAVAAWDASVARVSLNLRAGQTRYVDALSAQDVDTLVYGLSAAMPVPAPVALQAGLAVTQGRDEAVDPLQPFSRDLAGVRAFATATAGAHTLVLSLGALQSDYEAQFFGLTREDDQKSAAIGWQWNAFKPLGWGLGASVTYIDNSSTVPLYDYDRLDAGLTVRREFK